MPKPSYADIAQVAKVGTATVERVLNGRGGVSAKTAERVILAARTLDWPGRVPEPHRGIIRLEVILVRPDTAFYARLARAFRRISTSLDPSIQLQMTFLQEGDARAIARQIAQPTQRRSGLVIACPAYPEVACSLAMARDAGVPVVQIVSRILDDLEFVGIDNGAAGRLAALMVARLGAVKGSVVALCHSPVYESHRDRMRGFSDYLTTNATPDLRFRQILFGCDDQARSARRIAEAAAQWPDLAAVYNAGGANEAVLEELRRLRRKVFFVGHELSEATRDGLQNGSVDVVLDQSPEAQARRATDLLLAQIGLLAERVENPPIRFVTITAENL